MKSSATTVAAYLAALPAERRKLLAAVRRVIRANLDAELEEGLQYGMIGYYVPHRVYPAGYHCDPRQGVPYAGLAAQKHYCSLYLMALYGSPQAESWFRQQWAKTGKKLDLGKCCVRFRTLDDLDLDTIGEAIRRVPARAFLAQYEAALGPRAARAKPAAREKPTAKTATPKAAARRKPVPKKASRKRG